ncbi:MAG: hypothetical protein AAF447_01490 [Myxococcota bacterium]
MTAPFFDRPTDDACSVPSSVPPPLPRPLSSVPPPLPGPADDEPEEDLEAFVVLLDEADAAE